MASLFCPVTRMLVGNEGTEKSAYNVYVTAKKNGSMVGLPVKQETKQNEMKQFSALSLAVKEFRYHLITEFLVKIKASCMHVIIV